MNATLEAMDRQPVDTLKKLLKDPAELATMIKQTYLEEPEPEEPGPNRVDYPAPHRHREYDPVEAMNAGEQVEVDESRIEAALATWKRLTPAERANLLEACALAEGKAAAEELEQEMALRL